MTKHHDLTHTIRTSICFPACVFIMQHFPYFLKFTNSCLSFRNYLLLINTDSYTTEDIVFKWNATDIKVGTKQMAQFEYKGAKLSSDVKVFDIGKHCYHSPSIVLNSLNFPSLQLSIIASSRCICFSFLFPSYIFSAYLSSFRLPHLFFSFLSSSMLIGIVSLLRSPFLDVTQCSPKWNGSRDWLTS